MCISMKAVHTRINIWHLFFAFTFLVYGLFSITGCAPAISKQLREQVAKELSLNLVLKDPEAYKGKALFSTIQHLPRKQVG